MFCFRIGTPYAPINVKPEVGGGGGGGRATHGNLTVMCPQGGDFDHLIFPLQRAEEKETYF